MYNTDANPSGHLLICGPMAIVLVTFLIAVRKCPTKGTQGKRIGLESRFRDPTTRERHKTDVLLVVVGTGEQAVHITASEEAEAGETRPLVTRGGCGVETKVFLQGVRTERSFEQGQKIRSGRGSFLSTTSKGLDHAASLPGHIATLSHGHIATLCQGQT